MKPILPVPSTVSLKLEGGCCSVIRTLPSNAPDMLAMAIFIFMRYSSGPIRSSDSQPGMAPGSTCRACIMAFRHTERRAHSPNLRPLQENAQIKGVGLEQGGLTQARTLRYESRRVTVGSREAARRAGSQAATIAAS